MAVIEISGGLKLDGGETAAKQYKGDGVFAFTINVIDDGSAINYKIESVYRDSNKIRDMDIARCLAQGLIGLFKELSDGDKSKEYQFLGVASYMFIKAQTDLQMNAVKKISNN